MAIPVFWRQSTQHVGLLNFGSHTRLCKPWLLPACPLNIAGIKGGRQTKCAHRLPTVLAAPSNFLSLPSREFLKNKFLWRLTIHPWLLASCWPQCGWNLADLRRVACKWRNLSVWRRRSIMFFSILQADRLLPRSTHRINFGTPLSIPPAVPQAMEVLPQIIKHCAQSMAICIDLRRILHAPFSTD